MAKITDPDYSLPNILANSYVDTFDKGATSPLHISGICDSNFNLEEYVLKLRAGEGMSNDNLTKELIGAFIAKELDMDILEPVIIQVTKDFVITIPHIHEKNLAQNSLGINYGTKYVKYLQVIKGMKLSQLQKINASKVFLFDIIINNVDRRYEEKHNMFSNDEKFYIFDHEKAFSFVDTFTKLPFLKTEDSWLIKDSDLTWIKKHFFYNDFKGNILQYIDFINDFSKLDDNFWDKAKDLIPEEWNSQQYFNEIKEHISKIILNMDKYKSELVRILV